MQENFKILRKKFTKIKNMGLIESLRNGTTGIGYTFETLLDKKENSESKPDVYGIELKTKLGYSKSPITLFHCVPKRKNKSAINYIFEKYAYPKYNDENILLFEREFYVNKAIKKYHYLFKLEVNYYAQQIVLKSYYNNNFVEDVCHWDFKDLERKLKIKLTYLAIINAYPYKKKNKIYYKYLKMNSYKLKGFFEFLKLIEEDKISIQIYLKKIKDSKIDNHGVAFRIKNECIDELFYKLYY